MPWFGRAVGIEELCGSRLASPSMFHDISWCRSARRRRKIPWVFEERWAWSFSSKEAFKNVSWNTHSIPWIERQSSIAAEHTSGTRNIQGLAGNVGCSRAARCLKSLKISCINQGVLLVMQILNLSQELTHNGKIPLLLPGRTIRQFQIVWLYQFPRSRFFVPPFTPRMSALKK